MPSQVISIGERVVLSNEAMRRHKRPEALRMPDPFTKTRTLEANTPRLVVAFSENKRFVCFDYKGERLWFPSWACEVCK